jgi:hypothetical protein
LDLSGLLSALNQEVQMNALLPSGLAPNPPKLPPTAAAIVAATATARAADTVAATADVYHSLSAPSSPSLLTQSGVKAYVQLVNALSAAGHSEKSAAVLTNTLLAASATLKAAYQQAVSKLPPQLQAKDWRFSVSNGHLVIAAGQDELPPQDLADLHAAFTSSNVEAFGNEVAAAITSMESQRSAGADLGTLVWGRLRVDENNFDQVVDLRAYLTATAPGSRYSANAANPNPNYNLSANSSPNQASSANSLFSFISSPDSSPSAPNTVPHSDVPLVLAGMYLGDLVTARPDFFKPSVPARTGALEHIEAFGSAEISAILHGRCSCGEVCFTLENTFDYAFYCHCSRCRARTGSAFASIGGASIDKLRITSGNKHLLIEGECSDGYGARCSRCYSFLFAAVRGRQYVHVSLGVLAGTPSRLPDHHVYVGSKAPWYQISDALPQYDELP